MLIMEVKAAALNFINEMSGGDPVLRGMVSIWLLTVVSYFGRSIPNKIRWWLRGQLSVSMTILREADPRSQEFFLSFEEWFINNNKLSTRNRKTTTAQFGNETGFGYGEHLLFCKGRFYKLSKMKIEKSGDKVMTEQITIRTYGRNAAIFDPIIEEAKSDTGRRYFWEQPPRWSSNGWNKVNEITHSPTIFLSKHVEAELRRVLDFFLNNKDWYKKNTKPYRLNIILYGPPGTGKTEIVRWISDYLKSDIYQCLISRADADALTKAAAGLIPGRISVLALEDFESIALSREVKKLRKEFDKLTRKGDEESQKKLEDEKFEGIEKINETSSNYNSFNLSDFLNVLQGLRVIDNLVTVMTTNHIEWIDDAVIRGSRCNLKLFVGPLGIEEVKAKFEHQYEQPFPSDVIDVAPIKACDLDALCTRHAFDADGFIQDLKKDYAVIGRIKEDAPAIPYDEQTPEFRKWMKTAFVKSTSGIILDDTVTCEEGIFYNEYTEKCFQDWLHSEEAKAWSRKQNEHALVTH